MPVETTAVTWGLFTQLFLGDPELSTELAPVLPPISHQAFELIIPPPTNLLEKQPYKNAELLYNTMQFDVERHLDCEQDSTSVRPLMEIMNNKLLAVEQKLALGLRETYATALDEVDQSTLRQLYTMGKWVVGWCWPMIKPRLIEGKFVAFNDQGNYKQASHLAHNQLWSVNQAILAHKLYALELKKGVFTEQSPQIHQISNEINAKNTLFQLWQLRWNESRQAAALMFHLQQYQIIWQTLLSDNVFKGNMTGEVALKKYTYLKGHYQVADLLGELQAAYFNAMLSTKIQSEFSRYIEWGFSYATTKLANLTGPINEPRDWETVKKEANNYIQLTRDQLSSTSPLETDQNATFQKYFEAVRQDQFIYAKWLGQILKGQNSSFNWAQEAEDFENYQRKVNHLLDAYEFTHQMMTNLIKLQGEVFDLTQLKGSSVKNKAPLTGGFSESQSQIKEAFLFFRKIEELRILMRLGYLKKIQSGFNSSEKEILERFFNSLINKIKRFVTKGIVFDPTRAYEEVVEKNFTQSTEEFNNLLKGYELFLKALDNKLDVAAYRQEAQAEKEKFNNDERFYPVFFNYQELIKFAREKNYSPHILTVFIYNLTYQTDLTFLPSDIVETFIRQIKQLNECRHDLLALGNDFKSREQKTWITATHSCNQVIEETIVSFEKYIISFKNQQEPLTVERVVGSAMRKMNRFVSEGVISDSTDLYPLIINCVDTHIKKLNKSITQITRGLEQVKLNTHLPQPVTRFNVLEDYLK